MPGKIELADDFGAQEAHHVGRDAEPEPGKHLFRDRRAAEDVAPLEDDGPHARAGQVGRGHQPVVPAPDDDGVVALPHGRGAYML